MALSTVFSVVAVLFCLSASIGSGNHGSALVQAADPDYLTALDMSILFYEGQRSGLLDAYPQRNLWRNNSGLQDGVKQAGVRPLTLPVAPQVGSNFF